ncbi:hypothetical protein [Arthrobacter sp. NPDC057013]|uniref:hypothetical protein n=1 Tax=Arthrobacter sp. NPDC057013 TaxID=3345999 RepID=UPI00362B93F6
MASNLSVFRLDGVEHTFEAVQPDLSGKDVQRFSYGEEPEVIAELALADGSAVEIHGYAEHWRKEEVAVGWTDDDAQLFHAWIPAAKVRRPSAGEWHGNFVSR